jgi:hypothetical protein
MSINDFIQDYLNDKDEGLKALVTFFLNLVMQYEAEQQAGAGSTKGQKLGKLQGMAVNREFYKQNSGN